MTDKCIIIAEAGVNHNGAIATARSLIDAAANAGADVVKFQTFKASKLASPAAKRADYQTAGDQRQQSQQEMLAGLELTFADHNELLSYATKRGIQFLSSAFDSESAAFLDSLALPFVKIPSGEITNLGFLRNCVRPGRRILLSTGMATLSEVALAVDVLVEAGSPYKDIVVLQCHTDYPTEFEDANLRAMLTMKCAFPGVQIGYSDHTRGSEAAIAAVAMGACVIEKHFTLDRSLPGPDHAASLEPDELANMIVAVRNVERALGHGRKEPSQQELKIKPLVRKSIAALKAIRRGETLGAHNLTVKRPGTGISPIHWDAVTGRTANRDYEVDELIDG